MGNFAIKRISPYPGIVSKFWKKRARWRSVLLQEVKRESGFAWMFVANMHSVCSLLLFEERECETVLCSDCLFRHTNHPSIRRWSCGTAPHSNVPRDPSYIYLGSIRGTERYPHPPPPTLMVRFALSDWPSV